MGGYHPKRVAMPPPTEQGFQRENMGGFERIREVAMPPPTEQGFQRGREGLARGRVVAMPPPTEQGFQRAGRPEPSPRRVAMPPPTEQGFQPAIQVANPAARWSQCPLQQNKDFNNITATMWGAKSGGSQCPLQQNKGFNQIIQAIVFIFPVAMPPPTEQGFQLPFSADRPPGRRNAPSNRTRISTVTNDADTPTNEASQCPLQQNKDFNPTDPGFPDLGGDGRNAPSNRTRISTRGARESVTRARVAMPPPTEQGFQRRHWILVDEGLESQCPLQQNKDFNMTTPHASTAASRSQCPLQQNKDFNGGILRDEPGDRVAMPPPTEQGFQRQSGTHGRTWSRSRNAPSNRTRISTSPQRSCLRHSPSQCPLQQNKDFNVKRGVDEVYLSRRNAPSNRTRIPTMNTGSKSPSRMSQCPLQQNKDFNLSSDGPCPRYARSQCPLQQNKDFNRLGTRRISGWWGRNASSNRTRISTEPGAPPGSPWCESQCLLQQNKDFNDRHEGRNEGVSSQCLLQQNKDFNNRRDGAI